MLLMKNNPTGVHAGENAVLANGLTVYNDMGNADFTNFGIQLFADSGILKPFDTGLQIISKFSES